jgi:hypothetical protein
VTRTVGAPVQPQTDRTPRLGEWVIAAVLLVFFTFGYLAADEWPFKAALFPQIIAATGALLTLLRLVGLVVATIRGRHGPGPDRVPASALPSAAVERLPETEGSREDSAESEESSENSPELALVDDEAEEDESIEYVFASAGGRAWLEALAWIAAFFITLVVLGVFITVPLFALVYLKTAGKASWKGAALYAVVTGGLIYVLFRQVVYVDLPTGIFDFLQI